MTILPFFGAVQSAAGIDSFTSDQLPAVVSHPGEMKPQQLRNSDKTRRRPRGQTGTKSRYNGGEPDPPGSQ
jgi:hypothetical protein